MRVLTRHFQICALILVVAVVLFASACGGGESPAAPSSNTPGNTPSNPPGSSSGAINVTGTEKIGWNQAPDSSGSVARYQYLGYVDGVSQVLANAACGSTTAADGTFLCTASLPKMTAGLHSLTLAAQQTSGSQLISGQSAPIQLNVATSTAAMASAIVPQAPLTVTTFDGLPLVVQTLATGLKAPSAIVAAPDGRVFITGRDGKILVWQSGKILSSPAFQLSDAAQTSDVGLIGMSLDPAFASNGLVFVAYTARDQRGGFVHRVLRLRDSSSVFGQALTILEEQAVFTPLHPPRIRVAADHTVYITLPADDQPTAQSYGSYLGKLLRINQDGTTPQSNQPPSPIISSGQAVVGGFDWQPVTGRLWLTGRDWQGRDFLLDLLLGPRAASTFESPVDPSGAVFYPLQRIAGFANDLFIAALNGRHLRRVHFNRSDPKRIDVTEHLFDGLYGRISDVAVGPDGALYFSTSNAGTTSATAGDDRLLKVTTGN
jgi:glucose/arabinose dehydrogenase